RRPRAGSVELLGPVGEVDNELEQERDRGRQADRPGGYEGSEVDLVPDAPQPSFRLPSLCYHVSPAGDRATARAARSLQSAVPTSAHAAGAPAAGFHSPVGRAHAASRKRGRTARSNNSRLAQPSAGDRPPIRGCRMTRPYSSASATHSSGVTTR